MIININEVDYRISFKHINAELRTTMCTIEKVSAGKLFKEDGELVSTAKSMCNPVDNFNKDIGRKISLTRAIKEFPKEVRKLIWDSYLNRNKTNLELVNSSTSQ